MLRRSIELGDLGWEARVRAAHHRLAGTPVSDDPGDDPAPVTAGSTAPAPVSAPVSVSVSSQVHREFHRTLLEACGNDVLLGTFDRLWLAGELTRRWSVAVDPARDAAAEHRALEEATLARAADRAAALLTEHIRGTAAALVGG